MASLRLYVDEDACEHAVVQGLRARNIDVLTTIEAGRAGRDDQSQLAYATSLDRAIYTFNVGDFAKLHGECLRQNRAHAGIIVIPDQQCSVGEKVRRLASFVNRTNADEMVNCMTYL